jgi:hypothetical protein
VKALQRELTELVGLAHITLSEQSRRYLEPGPALLGDHHRGPQRNGIANFAAPQMAANGQDRQEKE